MTQVAFSIKTAAQVFLMVFALLLFLPQAMAKKPSDAAPADPYTGLWGTPNEAGWGLALVQQDNIIFATMFTYDAGGNPIWYVSSDCTIGAVPGCSGNLYKVTGGSEPTIPWSDANKVLTTVGSINITFSDYDNGVVQYMIDGAAGSKPISRQIFGNGGASASTTFCESSKVSQAHYDAIAIGMTLDQVNKVMGCLNNPSQTVRQTNFTTYGWAAKDDAGLYIQVFFDPTGTTVAPISGTSTFKVFSGSE